MYKLLIVDDEPLVQVGIQSMLSWSEFHIEVVGTAINGQAALQMIEEHSPDLVITDLKMPVMGGLELIRTCRENYGNDYPHFIILTSYEDFHMVKEALTYQVSDYLVKLELTPDSLQTAVERVLEKIQKNQGISAPSESIVHPFYEKFLIRLLNNLFDTEEQFLLQSNDLNLNFNYQTFACCYGEMKSLQADTLPVENQLSLFSTSMQMLLELANKYYPCYGLSLDTRHYALIFCYPLVENEKNKLANELKEILSNINDTVTNYYNVSFQCGIGSFVSSPLTICDSYQCARQMYQFSTKEMPITSLADQLLPDSMHNSFNISLFKNDLSRAFEEYNAEILRTTLDTLCELFLSHPHRYVQAMDGACNILFLSISLLQDGEQVISDLFKDNPDGYRSIYKQTTVEQIVNWLTYLKEQLCLLFENHHKDYKNRIVTNVKKYIGNHLSEQLSLHKVAAIFGISPNYLSQLFGKYSDVGFSEYINITKVNEAKRLLNEGNLKVYEVAELLGFESSFYFSKVFKKIEGVSPTDFLNKKG